MGIDISQVPYYLLEPRTQLKDILDDHRSVCEFLNFREWFGTHLQVFTLPTTKNALEQLQWLEMVYNAYEKADHFPSKRHSAAHRNAVQWLKQSHSRMSKPKFVPNLEYRVKFLMQSAYARLS